MEPVGVHFRSGKGYQIVHRCERCGRVSFNRVANDTDQPDDWDRVCRLPPR
jgi:hypothetical protein